MGTDEKKSKSGLTPPPLSPEERERRAKQIEEGANKPGKPITSTEPTGKIKAFQMRLPESYYTDLLEIKRYTGLTVNAICIELLRVAIKERLKELRNPSRE
jgi:hypothetical protein